MKEQITLDAVPIDDRPLLKNLVELYRYDFSEFTGDVVDERGLFGFHNLDRYWTEQDRHPFLIRANGMPAGFVLVHEDGEKTWIKVFFVMRKYRRQGIGRQVARDIFTLFPGHWRVEQDARNLPAQAFWRAVISEYTGGDFREVPAPPKDEAARLAFEFTQKGGGK
jgi:predicted acetyltransferase